MFGLAGWCWAVTAVYAGPINAEALAPTGLDEGLSVGFDGSFSLARGNVEWLDIGGAARVQHQSLYEPSVEPDMLPFVRQRWFGTVDLRFAERPDGPFINRGFSHARWTQMWSRRLGTEVFAQYAFDEFLRLQSRGLVGAGVRGVVRNRRDVSAWFGSGAMWETENIDVVEGSSDDTQTNVPAMDELCHVSPRSLGFGVASAEHGVLPTELRRPFRLPVTRGARSAGPGHRSVRFGARLVRTPRQRAADGREIDRPSVVEHAAVQLLKRARLAGRVEDRRLDAVHAAR